MSVSVALAPADGANPERLLKSADLALYKTKADGRDCIRFFVAEMDTELHARSTLERIIRDAVQHDRFELHYQPLFEMLERRLIGFEALIRRGGSLRQRLFKPFATSRRMGGREKHAFRRRLKHLSLINRSVSCLRRPLPRLGAGVPLCPGNADARDRVGNPERI